MTNQMNQMNRQQLFNLINTVSFAVDDLLLFLDTHPDDAEAIKAFHHYSDIRRNALQAYSDQYGSADHRHCRSMQSLELGNRTMAMGRRM